MTKAEQRRKPAPHARPECPVAHPPAPFRGAHLEILCALLVLTIWVAYWGVLSSDFINHDDGTYLYDNDIVLGGLSLESLRWALTSAQCANWHPVTWLSHMLDVQLFGLDAGKHHGVNLLLHTFNSILLLLILRRMTGALWRSAIVAFLFALHPLHVESVAWVSERKDVLSTLFWLLTWAAWLGFARTRQRGWYFLALALFALGLMTKPMLVTLPFTLLLLDFWPLRRMNLPTEKPPTPFRTLLVEKLPFFALSAASCAVTFWAQRAGGAVVSAEAFPLSGRLANAIWAYGAYLFKTVWPSSLALPYPFPGGGHPAWQVALAALVVMGATAFALLRRRKAPYLAFGWLWYLGTLIPVIGLVQVGGQSMADRYTYIPLIGVFVAVAWGSAALVDAVPPMRTAVVVLCVAVLLVLSAVTRAQVAHWADSIALFSHAIAVTPANPLAHNNLGAALLKAGRHEEGLEHLGLAVRYGFRSATTSVNLGNAMVTEGRPHEAEAYFRQAIQIKPDFPDAHHNLGLTLAAMGRLPEAEEVFRRTLELKPGDPEANHQLGRVLASRGRPEEAIGCYREALRLRPEFAEARADLGVALAQMGRSDEAVHAYEEALRSDPENADAHNNLGLALVSRGDLSGAESHFRRALRSRPDFANAHCNLGAALARQDRVPEAIEQFREALRLDPGLGVAEANLRAMEEALGSARPAPTGGTLRESGHAPPGEAR